MLLVRKRTDIVLTIFPLPMIVKHKIEVFLVRTLIFKSEIPFIIQNSSIDYQDIKFKYLSLLPAINLVTTIISFFTFDTNISVKINQ